MTQPQPQVDPDVLYQSYDKALYRITGAEEEDDILNMVLPEVGTNNSSNVSTSPSDIGSGTSSGISQNATGSMQAGKKLFDNSVAGYILGVDPKDGLAKLYIGNSTNYLNYDGSAITLASNSGNAVVIDFGSSILVKNGGNINFTSVTPPGVPTVTLLNVAGNLSYSITNNQYCYRVTFVTANGETSSIASQVITNTSASGQQFSLTNIPVSPSSAVTSRHLWRTKVMFNGDIPFGNWFFLATLSDNTTTTYTDNTADTGLTVSAFFNNADTNSSFGKVEVDGVVVINASASNTFIGQLNATSLTTGFFNASLGFQAMQKVTTGNLCTAVGYAALGNMTTGTLNVAIGAQSLLAVTSGNFNTGVGAYSLINASSGSNNTAVGQQSLGTMTTGAGNTALGYYAGHYASGSDEFYVNNRDRTNTAGDKGSSLLYGVFSALSSGQKLTINGLFNLSVSLTPASSGASGTQGDIAWDSSFIYVCTATDTWKRVGIATW